MPSGFSQSSRAGIDSVGWNWLCNSCTRVDSALSGRNAATSFSCRPLSLPPRMLSGPAPASQTSRMRAGRSQRSRDMTKSFDDQQSRTSRD